MAAASSVKYLLSLFLGAVFFLGSAQAQSSIGCFVGGECLDSIYFDITSQEDDQACLHHCKETIGCLYWTFYSEASDNGACLGFINCVNLNADSCEGCVSGDKDCRETICDRRGQCQGELHKFEVAATKDICIEDCWLDPVCNWWNYHPGTQYCTLLAECAYFDDRNQDIYNGERGCYDQAPDVAMDKLVLTGGCDTSGCTDEVQILDVSGSGQTCMNAPSFPYEVSEAMSFNINGYPWICGGTGVNGTGVRMVYDDCYWFLNGTWSLSGRLSTGRGGAAGVQLPDNTIWMTGGYDADGNVLSSTEYIASNGVFYPGPELPRPLKYHCMVLLSERYVGVIGGASTAGNPFMDKVYVFDIQNRTWDEQQSDLTYNRFGHTCQVVQGPTKGLELVVAGGSDNFVVGTPLATSEIMDYTTLAWRPGPDMPRRVKHATALRRDSSFLLVGGTDNSLTSEMPILEFDVEAEAWIERTESLGNKRYSQAGVVVDSSVTICA